MSQTLHSSGVQCAICLNRGFDGLNGGHGGRQGNLTQWRKDAEKKTGKWESESVGVGSPNPLGEETSPLRSGLFFAPAERYVYSRAICPKPCTPAECNVPICLNRGFDGLNGGHGGRQGNLTQWRKDAEKKTGKWESESVGVGSPNPLGEETSPLRSGLFFAPAERYVYSRAICPKPCTPAEHYVPFV